MPFNCPDIQSRLTALKQLKGEFDSAYAFALSTMKPTDLNRAQDLKKRFIEDMQSLRDILPVVKEEHAREILGREVFGKEAILTAFGIELEEADIPPIPFTAKELERAKDMGQMLILRIDKTANGKPMTLKAMNALVLKRWNKEKQGNLLRTIKGWKNIIAIGDAFTHIAPRSGWALVSKDVLPNSTHKNYIEQTDIIIKALKETSFKDMELPNEYVEAIAEFESQKEELTRVMSQDWEEASKQLSELNINQLTRQSTQEVIYDLVIYFSVHGERLLPNKFTWSNSCSSDLLVYIGHFDGSGVLGSRWFPASGNESVGVSLSRKASL